MKPSDPLQQHVYRAEVGNQQIGVDVEGLLQCQGSNHGAASCFPVLHGCECFFHRPVEQLAILHGKAFVMQRWPPHHLGCDRAV